MALLAVGSATALAETLPLSTSESRADSTILVHRAEQPFDIVIDGALDDPIWDRVVAHGEFFVTSPETLEPAPLATRIRMVYTDRGLYLSAEMEQDPSTLVERLSAHDQGFLTRDYFMFALDTSGEGRYGYWFQLSLGNSRADGTIQPERQFSSNWDGAWRGATTRTANGWSAEFYIPWSIVSMPRSEGMRKMAIYASRRIAHSDTRHGWPALTWSNAKFLSAFHPLALEQIDPRQQLSFFPYVASTHEQFDAMEGMEDNYNTGLDVFWRPTTDFQVTATMNPDFGTVEPDAVVINLSAVETFFPEKRLFFLEGQEVFITTDRASPWSSNSTVMLLHTRRIGQRPIFPEIPQGSNFEYSQFGRPSDLIGAAKLTGNVSSYRYGVLTAFEQDSRFLGTASNGDPISISQSGRDFAVGRLLYEDSNNGYKAIGLLATAISHPDLDAFTQGVDLHYLNPAGTLQVDGQLLRSDVESGLGYGGFFDIRYRPNRHASHEFVVESFDDALDLNDLGYLGRNDRTSLRYRLRLRSTEWRNFRDTSLRVSTGTGWNSQGETISSGINASWEVTTHQLNEIRIGTGYSPEVIDDRNSYGNGSFTRAARKDIGLRFRSDSSKRFYYTLRANWNSDYDGGNVFGQSVAMVYRPTDRFGAYVDLGRVERDGWLLFRGDRRFIVFHAEMWSPQASASFFINAKQHLRLNLQWQGVKAEALRALRLPETGPDLIDVGDTVSKDDDFAISRLSVQFRYQYEIAPMSDVYVVYTRYATLSNPIEFGFADMFQETLANPVSELLALKVRHHFGNH